MVLKGKGVCVPQVAVEELAPELLLRMRLAWEMRASGAWSLKSA